jgi:hypothetical protein
MIQVLKHFEKGLLRYILGVIDVMCNVLGNAENFSIVTGHEFPKSSKVTCFGG